MKRTTTFTMTHLKDMTINMNKSIFVYKIIIKGGNYYKKSIFKILTFNNSKPLFI